jgi:hypothetical protein
MNNFFENNNFDKFDTLANIIRYPVFNHTGVFVVFSLVVLFVSVLLFNKNHGFIKFLLSVIIFLSLMILINILVINIISSGVKI